MSARVLSSIAVLGGLVLLTLALRRLGLLREEHGRLFAGLVTQVTLPALIFSSLARTPVRPEFVLLALAMLAGEVACLALGWGLGRALRLPRAQVGTVMLVSGFGSSSLLGYALIAEIFPGSPLALDEAVVVSELGVGPALFTLGVMVAMYFGSEGGDARARTAAALQFFRSPIFLSMGAGLLWPLTGLATDLTGLHALFQAMDVLGEANTFCVVLAVGLALRLEGLGSVAGLALGVSLIKLVLQPAILWAQVRSMGLPALEQQVLILEACMPGALLSVVLAQRYGCDAPLASKLVLATTAASAFTMLGMFDLLAP